MSQPQGSIPPQAPQQSGPPQQFGPAQQFGPPPWQQGAGAIPPPLQQGPPLRPGHPVSTRTEAGGWWIASAVLAFLGAGWAVSVLGSIVAMAGFVGLFVGAQGGGEGLRQISDGFVQTTAWPFYLFLALQLVSIILGIWGGRNCLRGKASGALLTMLLGGLGVVQASWLGAVFEQPGRMVAGIVAALVLIVCPVLALFTGNRRTGASR